MINGYSHNLMIVNPDFIIGELRMVKTSPVQNSDLQEVVLRIQPFFAGVEV